MALDALTIHTDHTEYSRFESGRSVVSVRVVPTPTTSLNDTVTVRLKRRDGNEIAAVPVSFVGDSPKGKVVTIDLAGLKDGHGFPLAVRGSYTLAAESGAIVSVPRTIRVSLITAHEMKRDYCRGVPLYAREVLVPKKQPTLVAGVTIDRVSPTAPPGLYILKYDQTANTLTWNNGVAVEVGDGVSAEILPDDRGNYIEVTIDSFSLPAATVAEGIFIDLEVMSDESIQNEIDRAVSGVERLLGAFIEPLRVATDPYYNNPQPGEWFDAKVSSAAFYRREVFTDQARVWHVSLPVTHIHDVSLMTGYVGDNKVLDISNGAFRCNPKQGIVEVMPQGSTYTYIITFFAQLDFWGIREYIPDFWRYKGIAGLRDLEAELLKVIGYDAAITILTTAGQAARGGYSSESISKDGVSRSTSVSKGLYGDTIAEYKEWLKDNRRLVANRHKGLVMTTL